MTDGRFKKGHATWNKGMTGLNIGGIETRFKPGNKPHGWKQIGSERVDKDGILMRKYSDTGVKRDDWKPVHVHIWESVNGKAPKGCAVIFDDGNKRNFDIENLKCLTRAELLQRNTVHRFPKEIQRLCQLRGVLNRQINKRTEK